MRTRHPSQNTHNSLEAHTPHTTPPAKGIDHIKTGKNGTRPGHNHPNALKTWQNPGFSRKNSLFSPTPNFSAQKFAQLLISHPTPLPLTSLLMANTVDDAEIIRETE